MLDLSSRSDLVASQRISFATLWAFRSHDGIYVVLVYLHRLIALESESTGDIRA